MSTTRVNSGSTNPGMNPKIHEQPKGRWSQAPFMPVVSKTLMTVSKLVLSLFVPCCFVKMQSYEHPLIDSCEVRQINRFGGTLSAKESRTIGSFAYVGAREFLGEPEPKRCDLKNFLGLRSVKNLGRGSFGSVDLVVDENGKEYALKEIYHDPAKMFETIRKYYYGSDRRGESLNLILPEHENLVKAHAVITFSDGEYKRVTDIAELSEEDLIVGVLSEFVSDTRELKEVAGSVDLQGVLHIIGRQIGAGLTAMHNQGLIHRDLKPSNVLITSDGHVKVLDFGLSRLHTPDEEVLTRVGTFKYLAPEILLEESYDEKVDAWSFGVLLYELAFKKAPFEGGTIATYGKDVLRVNSGEEKLSDRFPKDIDPVFRDLLGKLICRVEDRISVREALKHPFFN